MWRGRGVQVPRPSNGDVARPWHRAVGSLGRQWGAAVACSRRLPATAMWRGCGVQPSAPCGGDVGQSYERRSRPAVGSLDGCAPRVVA